MACGAAFVGRCDRSSALGTARALDSVDCRYRAGPRHPGPNQRCPAVVDSVRSLGCVAQPSGLDFVPAPPYRAPHVTRSTTLGARRRCPTTWPGSRTRSAGSVSADDPLPRRRRRAPDRRRRQAAPARPRAVRRVRRHGRRRRRSSPTRHRRRRRSSSCTSGRSTTTTSSTRPRPGAGVPSVNARWGNIVAILAGDFLLARASALAASLGADVAGAARRARSASCAAGQVLELQHLFDADRSEEAYTRAIEGKTAALFATVVPHRRHGRRRVGDPTLDALTALRPPPRHVLPDRRRRARRHRDRRRARQARRPRPPRRRLHAAGDLRARASRPSCATCSVGPLDPEQLDPRCAAWRPADGRRSTPRSAWHVTMRPRPATRSTAPRDSRPTCARRSPAWAAGSSTATARRSRPGRRSRRRGR